MKVEKHMGILLGLAMILSACQPAGQAAASGEPAGSALLPVCTTQRQVIEGFFAANDAGDQAKGMSYLTDDVVFVGWAEGMNGRHLAQRLAVGKDYIGPFMQQDGLKLKSQRDVPLNFKIEAMQFSGNQVFFRLMPDRLRPNGRQYNPYAVEIIFRGCQIELIKVTERITWV